MVETNQLRAGDVVRVRLKGEDEPVQRYVRRLTPRPGGQVWVECSPCDQTAPYSAQFADPGDIVERVEAPSVRNGYDLVHHILPRVFGWKPWEHVEEMDGAQVANMLPGAGWMRAFLSGDFKAPGDTYGGWAQYALVSGQGIPYTGEAYVLTYGRGYFQPQAAVQALAKTVRAHVAGGDKSAPGDLAAALETFNRARLYGYPRGWRVAICEHEKVEGAGANHMRGWHPGRCRLCDMDMSVDSGD